MDQIGDLRENIQSLPLPEVYRALETRSEGLSQAEAESRLQIYGQNVLTRIDRKRLPDFAANFTHLMAMLLWVGGLIAFIANMPELGVAIWMVNIVNGLFSYWQEHKAEKAVEALAKMMPAHARVVRDGKEFRILAEELVPGDIVLLDEGDRISSDCRLIEAEELKIDQSLLSGESNPARKSTEIVVGDEPNNLVFGGTIVTGGTGKAVVYATGMSTRFGKITSLTQTTRSELSPLQIELKNVTRIITLIAIGVGLIFFLLAVLMTGMRPAEGFIFAIGIIVAFVPEGLLPTVTLALAIGVKRMAKRNAIIKKLSVVETLGSTTVICTDKTGTLTQNEMTVTDIFVGGQKLSVTGVGYKPEGIIVGRETVEEDLRQLLVAGGLCNDAKLSNESDRWIALGDPTEAALIAVAEKGGIDIKFEIQRTPRIFELLFDSRRKRMTSVHQSRGTPIAFIKGSPEEILALCGKILRQGQDIPLDDETKKEILAVCNGYASSGLRVLATAKRILPEKIEKDPEVIEQELVFIGLFGMTDPPRPRVREAVEKCHSAGVKILMITGDYGLTAESIARKLGIVKSQPFILTGSDLDKMNGQDLKKVLALDELILARLAPDHKLRVVKALQEMGQIVAVTGDGVNDAPALKKAHIGVAMGMAGTDVAKEASDMILVDDNFASIVDAIEEGRAVYANIKKFTSYIFTSNIPEAIPFILFALSGGRIPLALNIMQILAVDLGTDIVPALALGSEPPEPEVMDKPPRSLKEHVITSGMLARSYGFLGVIQSLAAMSAFYFQYWINGYRGIFFDLPSEGLLYSSATSMTLAAIVTTQIGNLFAQRTELASFFRTKLFSNRLIWVGIASELAILVCIIYIPLFQQIFKTSSLPFFPNWIFLFALMPSLLLADEIRKALIRWRKLA
jgi:P-type Ca2+ transporter type 2C